MSKIGLPGQTIGILGGGQLGRMVILEGRKLGYHFVTLDPAEDCPGGQVADHHIIAAYHDPQAMEELAERADLIIYEFENMDPEMVRLLEKKSIVPQGSHLLELTRHRLQEKYALTEAGVPLAPFRPVYNFNDLNQAITEIGLPAVLKTTTGGYDGKGQWLLRTQGDVEALSEAMFSTQREYILEQFIPFTKEISVIVARSTTGEVVAFPPTVNLHRHHILHMSIAPAPVEPKILQAVERVAIQVVERLEVVGLIAVEMFLLTEGQLLVNELAPRPHNSGHYTYDACATSQFAQFLRAVLGLPLGSPELYRPAVMVNVLGEHTQALWQMWTHLPTTAKAHWYSKHESKPGRKMGHITFLAETMEEALQQAEQTGIWSPLTPAEREAIYAKTFEEVERNQ